MLDLQPVQIHRDFDFGDQILSVQHAAPLLHVQNLDGENVRGLPQFLVREKKVARAPSARRTTISLLPPAGRVLPSSANAKCTPRSGPSVLRENRRAPPSQTRSRIPNLSLRIL